jgi:hypothetical protein
MKSGDLFLILNGSYRGVVVPEGVAKLVRPIMERDQVWSVEFISEPGKNYERFVDHCNLITADRVHVAFQAVKSMSMDGHNDKKTLRSKIRREFPELRSA